MAKQKPGRKPQAKLLPRDPLKPKPPAELNLSRDATIIYRSLARQLQVEGFASQADSRTVALAATSAAIVERLQGEVDKLTSLVVTGSQGQTRPHPLLAELRAEKSKLADFLGALLLTPRSRSSVRLSQSQARLADTMQGDPLEEFLG